MRARQLPLAAVTPSGSHAGKLRSATGMTAEKIADAMHRACELAEVAVVRQVSSHLRPVRGPGGTLRVAPDGPGTVDCLGVLRGGRGVAVEVKSCAGGRLKFSQLPDHQRAELRAFARMGGLSLVLVVVNVAEIYAVEWWLIAKALQAGEKSLGPDLLRPWRIDPRRPYLAAFLPETTRP